MREIVRHRAGIIFLVVLLLAVIGLLAVTPLYTRPLIFFGWVPAPFLAGAVFCLVWLVAYLVYFFRFWPYRH